MEYHDLAEFCRKSGVSMDKPFARLTAAQRRSIVEGTGDYYGIRGYFDWLESRTYKMPVRVFLSRYRSYDLCPDCNGARFKPEALLYRLDGRTIADVYALDVDGAADYFSKVETLATDEAGRMVLDEVRSRLAYLQDVGLGFLTLDRQSRTLSGGEVQRVALASALGSSLVNTLYVLDEPSIGLHPRDSHRLVKILHRLRALPNTVVVVEHDPEIIRHSDHLIDLGPGAGDRGGRIMYAGPTGAVAGASESVTGAYLAGRKRIDLPAARRKPKQGGWITLTGAAENNLVDLDVKIPLGLLVCVTGVSGSGKSTLAQEILYKAVKREKGDSQGRPGRYGKIRGMEKIADAVLVDQRAIGPHPPGQRPDLHQGHGPGAKAFCRHGPGPAAGAGPRPISPSIPPGDAARPARGTGSKRSRCSFSRTST